MTTPMEGNEEIVSIVREIARKHGWAVGEHGSMVRDIDLIVVPWIKDASPTWPLFEEIRDTIGADHASLRGDLQKPHGRQALMIIRKGAVSYKGKNGMDDWNPPAIDLSFIDPRFFAIQELEAKHRLHQEELERVLKEQHDVQNGLVKDIQHYTHVAEDVERLEAQIEELKKENEILAWNLAGCETYALGYDITEGHDKTMARPALDAVLKLALEKAASEKVIQAAREALEDIVRDNVPGIRERAEEVLKSMDHLTK